MKTQLQKPAHGKASYTEEYKQQALELWRRSGRSAAKVATELGIRAALLSEWTKQRRRARRSGGGTSAATGNAGSGEPPATGGKRETAGAARSPKKITGHPLRTAAERYARIEPMSRPPQSRVVVRGAARLAEWLLRLAETPAQTRTALRQRIREEFARSRGTYGSPRLARALGCPGQRNRIAA